MDKFKNILRVERRSFFGIYGRGSGGRNNTGRITVRGRGAKNFRQFGSNFFNFRDFFKNSKNGLYPSWLPTFGNLVGPTGFYSYSLGCQKYKKGYYNFSLFRNNVIANSRESQNARCRIFFDRFAKRDAYCFLYIIPNGSWLANCQLSPCTAPKIGCSFGSSVQMLRRRGSYCFLRLPSGEVRRVYAKCRAITTQIRKVFFDTSMHKAGQMRNLGFRPRVRGCAMNPVDHPHGGRTGDSRPSVSPWGQLTKGYRTRLKGLSKYIVKSVQSMKSSI